MLMLVYKLIFLIQISSHILTEKFLSHSLHGTLSMDITLPNFPKTRKTEVTIRPSTFSVPTNTPLQ